MTCTVFQKMISMSLDGMLDPGSAKELAMHLDACGRCREFQRGLAEMDRRIKAAQAPVATGIAENVKRRIAQASEREDRESWMLVWRPAPLLITVLLIALAVGSKAGDSLSKILIKDRHASQIELLVLDSGQAFSDAVMELGQMETSP